MPSYRTTTAAGLALAATMAAVPGTAHATTSVSCDFTGQAAFTPAVQTYAQSHSIGYRSRPARCVDRSDIGITSARFVFRYDDVQLDCTEPDLGTGSGTVTIEWTLSEGSRLTGTAEFTSAETFLNTANFGGTITAGPFLGQRFSGHLTTNLLGSTGACGTSAMTGGVTGTTYRGTVTIGT